MEIIKRSPEPAAVHQMPVRCGRGLGPASRPGTNTSLLPSDNQTDVLRAATPGRQGIGAATLTFACCGKAPAVAWMRLRQGSKDSDDLAWFFASPEVAAAARITLSLQLAGRSTLVSSPVMTPQRGGTPWPVV